MTLARLPPDQQRTLLSLAAASLKLRGAVAPWQPMPHQVPPEGDWSLWIMLGGRGAGKTDAGAHYVDSHANGPACIEGSVPHRIAVVAPSHDDAVETCVRGESGLLNTNHRIRFAPGASKQADLTWPNGSEARMFGSFTPEDVERFRGPQHCMVWADELAAWRKLDEAWPMIQYGLRLGPRPHIVATTTPKRRPLLKAFLDDPATRVSMARTMDNDYLPEARREQLYAMYGGTTLGRQELDAEILEDVQGALWKRGMIDATRISVLPFSLTRIVVAIDPSATSTESSDECGIVVAGSLNDHGYVLEDGSFRASPQVWAERAVALYRKHNADRIVAETNNGGEMVEQIIRSIDPSVSYHAVTASRGKQTRAEPISALYEQGRVHHVGTHDLLEDQMCQWVPGDKSPDRMDALVWAMTELLLQTDNPWARLKTAGGVA